MCEVILLGLVGNDIELDTRAVGRRFEPYQWRPCGVTWDAVLKQSWSLKLRRNTRLLLAAARTARASHRVRACLGDII